MMDTHKSAKSNKCNIFLYFSAFTANLASFSVGTTYCWTSPAIPVMNGQIDSADNPMSHNITPYEESWIASLVPLGSAISVFISGYLSERIGRKRTLLISTITMIVGFGCICLGTEIIYFYIGRFLCGVNCGTIFAIIPIYMGEISQSSNRGTLSCFFTFGMSMGGIFIFLLSPYVTLKTLSAMCLIAPLVFLVLFGVFVPESPYYYVSKGNIDMAEKALLKFRFNSREIVTKELSSIVKNVEESYANKTSIKNIYANKVIMRTFLISMGLMCFQQLSGINAMFFYMQSIFEENGSTISAENSVLVGGLLQLVGSICTILTADLFGRRILLITSAVGNALTLLVTGTYFYLKDNYIYVDNVNWLPVVTINLFILTYTLGIGPVSFAMIGELFPPNVRSLAATMSIFVNLCCMFLVTNIFPIMKEFIGLGLSFCLLGVFSCASCVFVYVKVPETKGKKLEEIQELLQNIK